MAENIRYSKFNFTHLRQLERLEKACFSVPWSLKSLENELNNPNAYYIVAMDANDDVIGYAGFWVIVDEVQIMRVAVLPDYRRRGIAAKMLRMLQSEWSDYSFRIVIASLEVKESNASAISLYKSLGFRPEYLRKGYYENKENAVIMVKYYGTVSLE